MTLDHDPASPSRPGPDLLARRSISAQVGVGTLALSVLVLFATYLLGGFDGLTANGVAALIFGVIASFALGIGLMVAVFYSSRQYDDAAHYAAIDHFAKQPRAPDEAPARATRP